MTQRGRARRAVPRDPRNSRRAEVRGRVGGRSGGWVEFGWAVEDDAGGEIVGVGVFGGAEGGVVAVHGGDAAEEELGDVGDGDGVETRDALAGELADEVAEERVDCVGGGEVGQVAEEFGGGVVVMSLVLFFKQAGVMRAQFQIGNGGVEAAVAAEPVDVAAASQSHGGGSRYRFGRYGFTGEGSGVTSSDVSSSGSTGCESGSEGGETPPPGVLTQECDFMGVIFRGSVRV